MMLAALATGHPSWQLTASGWDWTPLLGLILTLVLGWWMTGLRLGYWWIAVAVVGGELFALTGTAWGLLPAAALLVLVWSVTGLVVRRPSSS